MQADLLEKLTETAVVTIAPPVEETVESTETMESTEAVTE